VIRVVLSFPNGERQEVLLAGVPRAGDSIRLTNGAGTTPSYAVEHVLWMEVDGSSHDPGILVMVRPHVSTPQG